MFQSLYDSAWQHPGMAFLGVFAFVVALASTQRFLIAFSIVFAFEMAADALVTGAFSPTRGHSIHVGASIAFVVLGDYRFFLLLEQTLRAPKRLGRRGFGDPLAWLVAFALAMTVPVLSTIPQTLLPAVFANETRIFLMYEAMLFVLVALLRAFVLPRRLAAAEPDVKTWVLRLTSFELVQYGLWIVADVLILAGVELGQLLRILPNAVYYCGFLPFALFTAPARLWRVGSHESTR